MTFTLRNENWKDYERALRRSFSMFPEPCNNCDKLFFWGWKFNDFMPVGHIGGRSYRTYYYICNKCFPTKQLAKEYVMCYSKKIYESMEAWIRKKCGV